MKNEQKIFCKLWVSIVVFQMKRDRSGLVVIEAKIDKCLPPICQMETKHKRGIYCNFYLSRWRIIVSDYFLVTATFYVLLLSSDKRDS